MGKKVKCKICESVILLSIIIAVNYPICARCLKIKEHPDVPVEQKQDSTMRQVFLGGASDSAFVFTTSSDISINYPYKIHNRS